MDPDANLKRQQHLASRILRDADRGTGVSPTDAAELAELVQALNIWIVTGGFLPDDWRPR